jgi:hypothetical protein
MIIRTLWLFGIFGNKGHARSDDPAWELSHGLARWSVLLIVHG